ncbi:MAG: peptidase family protein [Ilumatobacteraceae bacterium]|nr:peptidase family protein [Ilumatobacteraceae bacterium]
MGIALVLLVAALSPSCYRPPVDVPISEPFVGPACTYCPGHRGIGYDTSPGAAVHAAAAGPVTFVGVVAGVRYVVVLHADGIAATYGELASSALHDGDTVAAGEVVGTATDELYFGLRRGDTYLDPTGYLGITRRRPRLVPSSGRPGRPAEVLPPACPALGGRDFAAGTGPTPR